MKIGLSYDLKEAVASDLKLHNRKGSSNFSGIGEPDKGPEDAFEEYDSAETIKAIKRAVESMGHVVVRLGGGKKFLENILKEKVDFVFNISEGLGNYRSREAQVPSVLEMLDIPYSGADPQCLAICLDKDLTKKLVSREGICTPLWNVISKRQLGSVNWSSIPLPAFVKPVWEGSSKGIRTGSLVWKQDELELSVTEIINYYEQPVIVEEFVPGEEVTVGIIGNLPPAELKLFGIMRVIPRKEDNNFVYSLEVKRDYENLVDYECPAKLEQKTIRLINEYSRKVFEVLGCRDFARLDFRISPEGRPYFLEINPLAGLNPKSSDLVIMAKSLNISYTSLITSIMDEAMMRCRLQI